MADSKITDLADGGAIQTTDQFVVARAGGNNKIAGSKVLGPVKIFDSLLGADAASIDTGAAAIPAGFSAIELLVYCRTDEAAGLSNAELTFNNDSGSNYDRSAVQTVNSSVSGSATNAAARWLITVAGASAAANVFASARLTFPNYDNTSGFKAGIGTAGLGDTSAGNLYSMAIAYSYRSTSAVSRAKLAAPAGHNLKAGSRLIIYGLP